MIVEFISNQNVPLFLTNLATSVFHLLEPRIAITLPTIAAVAIALTTSPSLVSLTPSLELESGNRHFALQNPVAAKVSGDESCQNFLFSTGVVTSPNHPGLYPDNLDKTQTLQVETGKILRLEFTHFAVYWGSTCQFDYVKITDGDGTILMDNSCGDSSDPSDSTYFQPPTITTRTNTVEIFFHTDDVDTRPGWSLSWIAVTPGSKDLIQTASFIHSNCHYKHFMLNQWQFKWIKLTTKNCAVTNYCNYYCMSFPNTNIFKRG